MGKSFEHDQDALLNAAREGNAEARERVIESCRGYLLAIAQGELDDVLRAKIGSSDIVQETCIKAHAAFHLFRGTTLAELQGWLRQVLVNDLVDTRRRFRGTQQRDISRESALERDPEHLAAGALVDQNLTPSSAVDIGEQVQALRTALLRLPEEYRHVIMWRNWDGLSFVEIGERLQRSEEASRKLWNRAVAKLSEEFSQGNSKALE